MSDGDDNDDQAVPAVPAKPRVPIDPQAVANWWWSILHDMDKTDLLVIRDYCEREAFRSPEPADIFTFLLAAANGDEEGADLLAEDLIDYQVAGRLGVLVIELGHVVFGSHDRWLAALSRAIETGVLDLPSWPGGGV